MKIFRIIGMFQDSDSPMYWTKGHWSLDESDAKLYPRKTIKSGLSHCVSRHNGGPVEIAVEIYDVMPTGTLSAAVFKATKEF